MSKTCDVYHGRTVHLAPAQRLGQTHTPARLCRCLSQATGADLRPEGGRVPGRIGALGTSVQRVSSRTVRPSVSSHYACQSAAGTTTVPLAVTTTSGSSSTR